MPCIRVALTSQDAKLAPREYALLKQLETGSDGSIDAQVRCTVRLVSLVGLACCTALLSNMTVGDLVTHQVNYALLLPLLLLHNPWMQNAGSFVLRSSRVHILCAV